HDRRGIVAEQPGRPQPVGQVVAGGRELVGQSAVQDERRVHAEGHRYCAGPFASCTLTVWSPLADSTPTDTRSPGWNWGSRLVRVFGESTSLPLRDVTMSPCWMPAASAGEPWSTPDTRAPLVACARRPRPLCGSTWTPSKAESPMCTVALAW